MTGPQALAIVKDIYEENVDVEDKLTAMQDVFCMAICKQITHAGGFRRKK